MQAYNYLFLIGLLLNVHISLCQDAVTPKETVNHLCSAKMYGRGYVKKGDKKAAEFINKELHNYGISPLGSSYFQNITFPMNTFPGKMEISLDGTLLKPVSEYVVAPESKGTRGSFKLHYLPQSADTVDTIWDSIINVDYTGKVLVADFEKRNIQHQNPFKASGLIIPKTALYWWASTGHKVTDVPMIEISDSLMQLKPQSISLNIQNDFIQDYKTQNVLGTVKGSEEPDSFIVFTAHYDHLGCMGKGNVFRGANDNASGTAMVLALAEYFAKPENKPKYSIVFLFFAAEESGLLGSEFFVKHPIFPLAQIKALVNLDMVGSGSDGITIVNGEKNLLITSVFQSLNTKSSYFSNIQIRGEACNSDHCLFDRVGVPAVFIYTRGEECKAYHNLNDIPENLPLTKFKELKALLIDFASF